VGFEIPLHTLWIGPYGFVLMDLSLWIGPSASVSKRFFVVLSELALRMVGGVMRPLRSEGSTIAESANPSFLEHEAERI
jgi:hypothetical protein